jgi:hypothetical protein
MQDRITLLSRPPRRWKVPKFDRAVAPKRMIEGGTDGESVEQRALEWYSSHEGGAWRGMHTENGVWLLLFGVLFADIIFGPESAAAGEERRQQEPSCTPQDKREIFPTRCMEAPIDWETPLFARRRCVPMRVHIRMSMRHALCQLDNTTSVSVGAFKGHRITFVAAAFPRLPRHVHPLRTTLRLQQRHPRIKAEGRRTSKCTCTCAQLQKERVAQVCFLFSTHPHCFQECMLCMCTCRHDCTDDV